MSLDEMVMHVIDPREALPKSIIIILNCSLRSDPSQNGLHAQNGLHEGAMVQSGEDLKEIITRRLQSEHGIQPETAPRLSFCCFFGDPRSASQSCSTFSSGMIDVFGRAGRFSEAAKLLSKRVQLPLFWIDPEFQDFPLVPPFRVTVTQSEQKLTPVVQKKREYHVYEIKRNVTVYTTIDAIIDGKVRADHKLYFKAKLYSTYEDGTRREWEEEYDELHKDELASKLEDEERSKLEDKQPDAISDCWVIRDENGFIVFSIDLRAPGTMPQG
eukprot:CAMPEP_0184307042 /NCGR_PEP_ID=MMETSP1049-20130417/15888_1 /TAXON_ID=77928 /ORGANISM="Proteomonas sulcata, Strain CCMP704" /LENGTH=270 /DNA_ID=CAMNT_0026619435 /DNA_START=35 /DNA_END=847 /DNA_ORIENTATION=+